MADRRSALMWTLAWWVARRYLRINGIWQDHLLYALLDTDTRP